MRTVGWLCCGGTYLSYLRSRSDVACTPEWMLGGAARAGLAVRGTRCGLPVQYHLGQPLRRGVKIPSGGPPRSLSSSSEVQASLHQWKGPVRRHQENVRMEGKCKILTPVSAHLPPPAIRKEAIRAQKGRREIIDLGNSYQAHGGEARYVR